MNLLLIIITGNKRRKIQRKVEINGLYKVKDVRKETDASNAN